LVEFFRQRFDQNSGGSFFEQSAENRVDLVVRRSSPDTCADLDDQIVAGESIQPRLDSGAEFNGGGIHILGTRKAALSQT
jgi:hypothetical protein